MTSGRRSCARTWSHGPQTDTAATTSSKLRIGAATHATPGTASPRSAAYPAAQIATIAASRAAGLVRLASVRRRRPVARYSLTVAGGE